MIVGERGGATDMHTGLDLQKIVHIYGITLRLSGLQVKVLSSGKKKQVYDKLVGLHKIKLVQENLSTHTSSDKFFFEFIFWIHAFHKH